jgi:DNA helicase-2/ATP-dependent DNA helicase PcrA
MQSITATIQKEQNTVIRYPDIPVLIVNGIAGSGKTSVLLQRIAYLFYQKRDSLRPDQVCLMTLNPVFRSYIDNVLPDLGETNPLTITWHEFLDMVNVPFIDNEYDYTSNESLLKIHEDLPKLTPEADDFFDIRQKSTLVMTKKEVLGVVNRYRQFPMGVRLFQTVSDELEQRAKSALKDMEIYSDEGSESVAGSDRARDNRTENDFGGALRDIKNCSWIDVLHVAGRILGRSHITAAEWLYTRMELTGECDRNMKYVMIDEVQDYTVSQLAVFRKYFPNARFMLLGDEFQSIREDTVTFSEIEEMFSSEKKKSARLPLMTSYRSSPEITDMFASLLPEDEKVLVSSVQRPGEDVFVKECVSDSDYIDSLKAMIGKFENNDGLTAVICRDQFSLEKVRSDLGNDAPPVIAEHDALPHSGAFLIELALAKGLEFDSVILPDADSLSYPDSVLGTHCLYTAMSRATRHLAVLSRGSMSVLVKK